ncbi:MAG: hypothetical protein Q9227_002842 [Pyrenula ochraceoflavens]
MGNDGGSIPKRAELVKEAARNPTTSEIKETQKEQQAHLWTTCPLSHKPLTRPIVSDSGGNLYNKDAIIQYLLPEETSTINKEDCEKLLGGRVKSLKDVVEVNFTIDESAKFNDGGERYKCPITGKQLGPAVKAVYIVPCGHAFSYEAVKEMKTKECLQCAIPYETENVIPILTIAEDDAASLKNRIEKLMASGLTHSLRKASGSKKRKGGEKGGKSSETSAANLQAAVSESPNSRVTSTTPDSSAAARPTNAIKNTATANLTAKVMKEEENKAKRRRIAGENENLKSLFTKSDGTLARKDIDFMNRGFSIPASGKR